MKTKLAIIGSGPAGYSAAIYTSRALLEPVLFSGVESGGQLMYTTVVENFPGFKDGKMGPQLMMEMRAQAERFGTKIQDMPVTAIDLSSESFKIWTNFPQGYNPMDFKRIKSEEYSQFAEQVKTQEPAWEAESIIIATGATSIMLGIPGEDKLMGRGVAVCAVCDAAFYKDKVVYVVGGGDSAMEDALALTRFAKQVYIVHRRSEFKASKIMQDRVLSHENIKVLWNTSVIEAIGDQKLERIKIKDQNSGEEKELPADGLFYAIGHRPVSTIFNNQIKLDEKGYIVTSQSVTPHGVKMAQEHINQNGIVEYPTMTSVDGVFASGDVVDIRFRQAITSAGQGAAAALDAERWLEKRS